MNFNIEKKVQASTLAAAVSGLIVYLLGRFVLHGAVSSAIIGEIDVVVPLVITFVAGWLAPHTPRPVPPPVPPVK